MSVRGEEERLAAVAHLRGVAPGSVSDAAIERALEESGLEPCKLRAVIDGWWREHQAAKEEAPRSKKKKKRFRRVDPGALTSPDAFAKWLDSQKTTEAFSSDDDDDDQVAAPRWVEPVAPSEKVKAPPVGYVPPEVARKRALESRQPWQRRYAAHLAEQANALRRFMAEDPDIKKKKKEVPHHHEHFSSEEAPSEEKRKPVVEVAVSTENLTLDATPSFFAGVEESKDEETNILRDDEEIHRYAPRVANGGGDVVQWRYGLWSNGRDVLESLGHEIDNSNYAAFVAVPILKAKELNCTIEVKGGASLEREKFCFGSCACRERLHVVDGLRVTTWRRQGEYVIVAFPLTKKTLTLTMRLKYFELLDDDDDDDDDEAGVVHGKKRATEHHPTLLSDLQALRSSEDFADVSLVTATTTIRCHGCVLAAASPVLKEMLTKQKNSEDVLDSRDALLDRLKEAQPEEKEEETVVLRFPDLDARAARQLLDYVYSGALSFEDQRRSVRDCSKLVDYARTFDMGDLLAACEDHLCASIRIDNVGLLMKKANDLHKLRDAITQFHLNLVDAPAGVFAFQCAAPDSLTPDLEDKLTSSLNATNLAVLLALAEKTHSPKLKQACLAYSLKDRDALKSDDFKRVAASTSLGIDMLRAFAASSGKKP